LLSVIKKALILAAFLILLPGCAQKNPAEIMLLDFESEAELDQLGWRCHTLFSLSDDHATHGAKSLKIEFYPSEYPGLAFSPAFKDWRNYKALRFDVFNPSDQLIQLTVRIDDKKDYPDYDDRYNKDFVINPGTNHIAITRDTLETSRTNRSLDLANIQRMLIFEVGPQKKNTLFIDAVRLQ
jgi:hypothetical protein